MTPERYQALLRWLEARPALKKLVIALNRWLPAVPFACYPLLLVLLGCIREWLAAGTVFGVAVSRPVLPMAGMPAGGFIVLGVVCAIWRALARKRQKYLKNEARGYLAVHPQENRKEAEQ